mgnify:CR=1 FL=1
MTDIRFDGSVFRRENGAICKDPELIKEFRDYLAKQDPNYVNKNGIRCCDAVKELDLIYKKAVIKVPKTKKKGKKTSKALQKRTLLF